MSTALIVLAAGQGTRMKSELPKVLHRVGGDALSRAKGPEIAAMAEDAFPRDYPPAAWSAIQAKAIQAACLRDAHALDELLGERLYVDALMDCAAEATARATPPPPLFAETEIAVKAAAEMLARSKKPRSASLKSSTNSAAA